MVLVPVSYIFPQGEHRGLSLSLPEGLLTWKPEPLDAGKVKKNMGDMATHSWSNCACQKGVMSVTVCTERIRQMMQAGIENLSLFIIT